MKVVIGVELDMVIITMPLPGASKAGYTVHTPLVDENWIYNMELIGSDLST